MEQVRGLPVDRRADVFSLGAVLHEALTGERLFRGPSDLAVLERVRTADVGAALAAQPRRCRRRSTRWCCGPWLGSRPSASPWAGELAEALRPFAAGAGAGDLPALLAERFAAEAARERAWQAGDPGPRRGGAA